jgi:hypothetical protein
VLIDGKGTISYCKAGIGSNYGTEVREAIEAALR